MGPTFFKCFLFCVSNMALLVVVCYVHVNLSNSNTCPAHTHTHTHCHFTAICLGQPGLAGTRRDIHPLTPETCCGIILDFMMHREDNKGKCADNPAKHHPLRTINAPTSMIPQFYAGCPSCRNPPNLFWLGSAPNTLNCIRGSLVNTCPALD